MNIEQLEQGQLLLNDLKRYKIELEDLKALRNVECFYIFKYFAQHGYFSSKTPVMIKDLLEEEIRACERAIEKSQNTFDEL